MMKTCFCSHFWWLSTLLVLSSYSVNSIEAGLLRSRVSSSSSSTATTINRSLAEQQDDQEQEEGLFADSIPTHATPQLEGETKTITIPCLYNLQFFEGSGLYAIPPEGPTPEELEGLLRATEKFYTHQMKIDPVFGNDFVSFQMLEDNHRLVLAGTVDPGPPPPRQENNNDNEQQQPEQERQEQQAAAVVTNTTTLKLEVYARVELVSSSQLTQEQTAMAMPAYDLTQLIRGYLWKADPQYYANDDNAEDATTAEAEHPQQKKNNNLFHQTHWLEIIATYSTVGEGFEELLTNDSN